MKVWPSYQEYLHAWLKAIEQGRDADFFAHNSPPQRRYEPVITTTQARELERQFNL